MLFAILAALASAATFAAGSALQHRVAGDSSADEESRTGFVSRIVRRPSWVIGLGLSGVAFALHALALSHGDLALVQPVIVSGIVFAVFIRAGLDHRFPERRTMIWVVLTWAGLALFLFVRPDSATGSEHIARAPVFLGAGILLAAAALLGARRATADRRRGILLAAASGLLFGLVAGLLKLVLVSATEGWGQVFVHFPVYALLVIGAAAIVLNQRAYQATRLSVTAPILNIAQVVVAISFGVTVFDEDPGSSLGIVIGEVVGLVMVIVGIRQLSVQPERAPAPQDTPAAPQPLGA